MDAPPWHTPLVDGRFDLGGGRSKVSPNRCADRLLVTRSH